MEFSKKNRTFGAVAGVLYLVFALWAFYPSLPSLTRIGGGGTGALSLSLSLLTLAGFLLLASGLLSFREKVSIAGISLVILVYACKLIARFVSLGFSGLFLCVNFFLLLIAFLLILLALINKGGRTIGLGVTSACVLVIAPVAYHLLQSSGAAYRDWQLLRVILEDLAQYYIVAGAALFTGLAMSGRYARKPPAPTDALCPVLPLALDSRAMLNILLDSGVISTEEYEDIKKRLLGV